MIKVELPPNVTAKNAEYLSGNVSEVDVRANLSLKAFVSGNMQTALESEVGNNIPFLADALLHNAAVQRNAIACSNSVFNWKCYPTFYGSHYVVDPQHNALFEMPLLNERKISDRNTLEKGLVDFGKSLSIIAKEYPEKRFYVVIADRSSTSASNPASALVSETMFSNECAQVIATEISDNTNVSINVSTYDSVEKYLEDYYPTDHHWNGYGAIHAMPREVIEENTAVPSDEIDPLSFGKLIFDGTSSRRGLICLNKGVAEPNFNVGEITADKTTSRTSHEFFPKMELRKLSETALRQSTIFMLCGMETLVITPSQTRQSIRGLPYYLATLMVTPLNGLFPENIIKSSAI